jgi:GDP-mannose 6-dehydrogenase
MKTMKITVFGLGYVGCVSAACLAQKGYQVIGVDVNPVKVDLINQGKSPIVEKYLDEIFAEVISNNRLRATTDVVGAIAESDVSLICVGTPSQDNGSLDLQHIRNVSRDVGRGLRQRDAYHVVAVRSTVLPGTIQSVVIPLIENESYKQVGSDFGVCMNPEFLREASAIDDYHNPAFTLIGAWDQRSGIALERVYKGIDAPVIQTDIRIAEMVKYASNAFHALKICFSNEIGALCKEFEIDSHRVMDIFARDTQLNISSKYLKPGFAFGGSCLPKDVRAILHEAKSLDINLQLLQSILPSNEYQIERVFRMVQRSGRKKVGIIGLSFKEGTDDLRESPLVQLAEKLLGKGYNLSIYDRNVSLAAIMGSNKQYIQHVIPHISKLLVSNIDQVVKHAEVLIVGNNAPEFRSLLEQIVDRHQVIDLVRLETDVSHLNGNYHGVSW